MSDRFEALVARCRVVLFLGPGGVGKTTTAAATAVALAAGGRKVCVLTIDPARRLAQSLGLASMGGEPVRIAVPGDGELWAVTLDPKGVFDDLVRRRAPTPEAAERVLANPFYQRFSRAMSGVQEMTAAERLYDLALDPRFDVVVVDTPPTAQALDFLDAPRRLMNAIDRSLVKWVPGVGGSAVARAFAFGSKFVYRVLTMFTGEAMLADLTGFLQSFQGMYDAFHQRAVDVEALLSRPDTGFFVVTAAERRGVAEAGQLTAGLAARGLSLRGVVCNRAAPLFGPVPDADAAALVAAVTPGAAAAVRAELVPVLHDHLRLGALHAARTAELAAAAAPAPVLTVAPFDADVLDVPALVRFAEVLFSAEAAGG